MSARLLESVCADDAGGWREGHQGARDALVARLLFWDAISALVGSRGGRAAEAAGGPAAAAAAAQ